MSKEKLHELLQKIINVASAEELEKLTALYSDEVSEIIINDIRTIGNEIITLRNTVFHTEDLLSSSSTAQERTEINEVMNIIDNNLFDYHFQPIVNTADGEIYSYEALMRPRSTICPSPYHILKYAELTGRLNDIEKCTLINILSIMDSGDIFHGKKVFINSIPSARLNDEDMLKIIGLLKNHCDEVVIEMTEQSELNEKDLDELKQRYRSMNLRMAVDDYGTGYANVHNLLRYMPDYVKIDRSLLSEIQNNSQKRYFVREIIDFCHSNGILALAEGIETAEEMRTVIHLDIDLIQGYYTARPSANVPDTVPAEIRQEIKRYRQEREDGRKLHIYTAAPDEHIFIDRITQDDYRCILVGKDGSGDVIISGTPDLETKIHIDVANGFSGSITLENVSLSNVKGRPCIDIGENCKVHLIGNGLNRLKDGGIRVPESSHFIYSGKTLLNISINGSESYAIGNDHSSRHGELAFEQGVNIDCDAAEGICIGSGLGGRIRIAGGQYTLNMTGYSGVGIGALYADAFPDIFACNLTMNINLQNGVAIGSLEGNCYTHIYNSALKLNLSGSHMVGVGTLSDKISETMIYEANTNITLSADHCSAIAALNGRTYFKMDKAGITIVAKGNNALALGGSTDDTDISIINSTSSVTLVTKIDNPQLLSAEINGGQAKFTVNEVEIVSLQ